MKLLSCVSVAFVGRGEYPLSKFFCQPSESISNRFCMNELQLIEIPIMMRKKEPFCVAYILKGCLCSLALEVLFIWAVTEVWPGQIA